MEKFLDKLDSFQTKIEDKLSGFKSPSDLSLPFGPKECHLYIVYPSTEVQKENKSYLDTLKKF